MLRLKLPIIFLAMHPIYGFAWTDGQNVFIVPMNSDHGVIDIASSVKLGTFQWDDFFHLFQQILE